MIKHTEKDFGDTFGKLYPESAPPIVYNADGTVKTRMATKNVTIVVTEECCLRCSYCLGAGTKIRMEDGTTKNIEDIVVGDKVVGFNENQWSYISNAEVTTVFARRSPVIKIKTINNEELIITKNHKVVSWSNRATDWREAGELSTQDGLIFLNEDNHFYFTDAITEIEELDGERAVYNLETTTGTYIANGFCVHNCYQHNKNPVFMSKETTHKIVDFLFQKDAENNPLINPIDANCLILDFIGGEPFMAVDIIDEFMRYFRRRAVELNHRWQNNYMISISTNGILYNTPEVQDFVMKNKERLSLTITIDGNKELHDSCRKFPDGRPSYDIVEASVKAYQKLNPYLSTKLTLAPANIQHTFEAVKHLYENLKLQDVYMNCVYEEGWTYEHAKVLYEQLIKLSDWMIDNDVYQYHACSMFEESIGKPIAPTENNTYCGGCGSMLCFTPDGHIQPCLRYTHFNLNDKQPEMLLGTLERGLAETDEDKETISFLNTITRRVQSTDECFNCPIGHGCGTCSAYDYECHSTPAKRVTFICPMHKARVLANCYFWNKVYRKEGLPQRFAYHVPDEWALNIISQEEIHKLKNLAV
jgi:uncharacterized protein